MWNRCTAPGSRTVSLTSTWPLKGTAPKGDGALFSTRRTQRRGTASGPPCPVIIDFGVTDFPELYSPSFQPLASPRTPKPCTTRASLIPGTTGTGGSPDRHDRFLARTDFPGQIRCGSLTRLPAQRVARVPRPAVSVLLPTPGLGPGAGPPFRQDRKTLPNHAKTLSTRPPSDIRPTRWTALEKSGQKRATRTLADPLAGSRQSGHSWTPNRPSQALPLKRFSLERIGAVTSGVPCEVTHE